MAWGEVATLICMPWSFHPLGSVAVTLLWCSLFCMTPKLFIWELLICFSPFAFLPEACCLQTVTEGGRQFWEPWCPWVSAKVIPFPFSSCWESVLCCISNTLLIISYQRSMKILTKLQVTLFSPRNMPRPQKSAADLEIYFLSDR